MLTDVELRQRLRDLEAFNVERTEAARNTDKLGAAICAFANDLPDSRTTGVLFVGARDNGDCAGLEVTEQTIQTLMGFGRDGQILPLPNIHVRKITLDGCTMAVAEVMPSDSPPVRFKGRICVRFGPSRAFATPEQERRLVEKQRRAVLPFDQQPVAGATLEDLNLLAFQSEYLPAAIAPDVLEENGREVADQLRTLKLLSRDGVPTTAGILVLGRDPRNFLPGAYIQFVRYAGTEVTDTIRDQKEIDGSLSDLLRRLDEILEVNIVQRTDLSTGSMIVRPDYPVLALQELARNAVIHRTYDGTNAPVRLTWFDDRVEITNPGGPFGAVSIANFGRPEATDYRNPVLASAAKDLGYVQRFGSGIPRAALALRRNGNPPAEFQAEADFVHVTVRAVP
jgi:ATP-dependent DNA helicase RecG